jgi:hypothetical protein
MTTPNIIVEFDGNGELRVKVQVKAIVNELFAKMKPSLDQEKTVGPVPAQIFHEGLTLVDCYLKDHLADVTYQAVIELINEANHVCFPKAMHDVTVLHAKIGHVPNDVNKLIEGEKAFRDSKSDYREGAAKREAERRAKRMEITAGAPRRGDSWEWALEIAKESREFQKKFQRARTALENQSKQITKQGIAEIVYKNEKKKTRNFTQRLNDDLKCYGLDWKSLIHQTAKI